MIIHVTQKHVNKGKSQDCTQCPIALAIREQAHLPIQVYRESFQKGDGRDMIVTKTPRSVYKFVRAFDGYSNAPIKPFNFRLPAKLATEAA